VEYRVVWEIEVNAETPEEAAQEAFAAMQDPDTLARHFTVYRPDQQSVSVDLGPVGQQRDRA
jgi:hypothetical protein